MRTLIKNSFRNVGLEVHKAGGTTVGLDMEVDLVRACGGRQPKVLFDVGANQGQTAQRFSNTFPGAKIYSFEPVPGTFSKLQKVAENCPQVRAFNLALGAEQTTIEIPLRESSTHNTLVRKEGDEFLDTHSPATGEMVQVQVETVTRICEQEGITRIDLLKTDTEGFDLEVVRGAEPLIQALQVPFIYAETGLEERDRRWTPFTEIRDWLGERGYRVYGQYEFCRYENPETPYYMGLAFCNTLFVNPEALKKSAG